MKKFILFSVFILLAVCSCKKQSTKITNTLSATIDGVNETFPDSLIAATVINSNDPKYTISVTGLKGSSASREGLGFSVNSDSPITKGTYTITSQTNTNRTTFPFILYWKGSTNSFNFSTDESGANVTTITITYISSTNVQGIFSGVLISQTDDGATRTITDGKFDVNITPI